MKERNNYKQKKAIKDMNYLGKRGQATLFVIIAIIIIAGIILAVIFTPKFKPSSQTISSDNPKAYIESCISDTLYQSMEKIGMNGGFIAPEGNLIYQGEEIKYLCYTNENYKPCVIQEPLLKAKMESEMDNALKEKVDNCVKEFVQQSAKSGNKVSLKGVNSSVQLNPGKINIIINAPMTITKEVTRNYDNFDIEVRSKMYDLALISTSILSFEATYGDSEITTYLQYYPDLKIEKINAGDGNRIYIVSDVVTNEKVRFASRSLALPPGEI